jgi:hypothetical protein
MRALLQNDPIRSVNARLRKRQGRCYELAWRVMAYSDIAARLTLVHSVVENADSGRFGHACIETDWGGERAFMIRCSTTIFSSAPGFAECRYGAARAMELSVAQGHYGPW